MNPDLCFLGWDGYERLLATDIDIVILATPPCFRPMMLEAAVAAGKHVFMEKPAAVDAPGIRKIMAAGKKAREAGLCIVAGTQRRHDAKYRATIEHIHEGVIGDVVAARAYWCGGPIGFHERQPQWSDMEYQMRNWYHYLWLSGDHIVEQHVHNLDVINWVMGKHPVKAYGYGGRAWQEKGNIWDHHAVDFTYANGVHLASYAKQIANSTDNVSEFVVGTQGQSNCASWIGSKDGDWNFQGEWRNPYVQEHADLIQAIRKGEYINEAQNVAESTMTAIMGRMAEYSGKEITWDEALNSEESLALDKYEFGPIKLRPVAIPGGKAYGGEGWVAG
jgi:predicted dehydrogenase